MTGPFSMGRGRDRQHEEAHLDLHILYGTAQTQLGEGTNACMAAFASERGLIIRST